MRNIDIFYFEKKFFFFFNENNYFSLINKLFKFIFLYCKIKNSFFIYL